MQVRAKVGETGERQGTDLTGYWDAPVDSRALSSSLAQWTGLHSGLEMQLPAVVTLGGSRWW